MISIEKMSINLVFRAHLIHDLRPYICTYANCKNSDFLYDTRQDWIRHESEHRRTFHCPKHEFQVFHTKSELKVHLMSDHSNYGHEKSDIPFEHSSDSISRSPDRDCPICWSSQSNLKALQNHIALHLERFSLFSLPRNVCEIQNDFEEAESDQAINAADDSPVEDFDTYLRKSSRLASFSKLWGQSNKAEELQFQVTKNKKKVPGVEDLDLLSGMANLEVSTLDKNWLSREIEDLHEQLSSLRPHCLGTTLTGRRCLWFISKENKDEASVLLEVVVSGTLPRHEAAHNLRRLTSLMTCHHHQAQVSAITQKWVSLQHDEGLVSSDNKD